MVWWTGLAPWEFEFPFPGSLISTFPTFQIAWVSWLWLRVKFFLFAFPSARLQERLNGNTNKIKPSPWV
jgi:hypothetical protein